MAEYTSNLNLEKPSGNENFQRQVINGNMDKVDKKFGIGTDEGHTHDGTAGQGKKISYNNLSDKPAAVAPTAHKSTHAAGGADALTSADIGAAAQADFSAHLADNVKHVSYGTASGTNDKTITLNPVPAAYVDGIAVSFKNATQNTGAVTLNVNNLGAKAVLKSNGGALASGNLKTNSVYTVRYNGTNFILQGEGGEYGTAGAAQVLDGYNIGTDAGLVEGTIPSKSAATYTPSTVNQTIATGQYLSGIQTIYGDANLVSTNIKSGANIFGVAGNVNVVDTSAGDATAAQILTPKKAYVDGALVTGTMPNNASQTSTLQITGSAKPTKAVPAGYTPGGTVTAELAAALAASIASGVTIGGVLGTNTNKKWAKGKVNFSSFVSALSQEYINYSISLAFTPSILLVIGELATGGNYLKLGGGINVFDGVTYNVITAPYNFGGTIYFFPAPFSATSMRIYLQNGTSEAQTAGKWDVNWIAIE